MSIRISMSPLHVQFLEATSLYSKEPGEMYSPLNKLGKSQGQPQDIITTLSPLLANLAPFSVPTDPKVACEIKVCGGILR